VGSLLVQLHVPLIGLPAGSVIRHWFAESFRRLGGDLRRQLLAQPVPPADIPVADGWKVGGRVGDVWAYHGVEPDPEVAYSDSNYEGFLAAVERGVDGAALNIGVVSPSPVGLDRPLLGKPMVFTAFVVSSRDSRVGLFNLDSEIAYLLEDPTTEGALLALVRETASACGVIDGHIEGSLGGADRRPWLLLLSDPVGHQLGGLEGLDSSGLFAEVSRLPRGGYWLQATRRFNELDQETARRVAELQLRAELIQRKLPTPYGLAGSE